MNQVTIIKSDRKTISIQVDLEQNIIVRAPKQMTKRQIDAHLEKHRDWIDKKSKVLGKRKVNTHQYEEGETFFLYGEERRLTYLDNMEYAFQHEDGLFKIDKSEKEFAREMLLRFYKDNAKYGLIKRAWMVSKTVNLSPKVFKVSSAEKRWGSCSGRGNINLSFHLMPFPFKIIDYVVVHELAHLHHMDHSKAFWSLVEKMMPDYKSRLKWMEENAHKYKI